MYKCECGRDISLSLLSDIRQERLLRYRTLRVELHKYIKKRGCSLRQISQEMGIDKSGLTVQTFLEGSRVPKPKTMFKIENYLDKKKNKN